MIHYLDALAWGRIGFMAGNIALVGCGAIAQAFYLPALAQRRADFNAVWVIDPNDRARETAAGLLDAKAAKRLADVDQQLDYIIVAAPNSLHFAIAQEALARGAHVLVEKPFVLSPADGVALIAAAEAAKRLVVVNQTRRFFPYAKTLRAHIAAGDYGALLSATHYEGEKLAWPFESGAGFARTAQRTGVIMDLGVHVLDFYHYLLQPTWRFVSARHDGFAGPEGLAEIELKAGEAPVSVRISRYLKQANKGALTFERAVISFGAYDLNACEVKTNGAATYLKASDPAVDYNALAARLIDNFIAAGRGEAEPVAPAASSLPVIQVLDTVYERAGRYPAGVGVI